MEVEDATNAHNSIEPIRRGTQFNEWLDKRMQSDTLPEIYVPCCCELAVFERDKNPPIDKIRTGKFETSPTSVRNLE